MNVEQFLQKSGVSYEKHWHPVTYTSQALAETEHVSGYEVAKPVIVKGQQGFAMCVLPAPAQVDLRRVAGALHEPQVRLATEGEMEKLFPDCELGAEPPIGALFNLPTVADPSLKADEYLIMQAGSHNSSIRLKRADWEKVAKPTVAAISAAV